jgi:hypothetical protein
MGREAVFTQKKEGEEPYNGVVNREATGLRRRTVKLFAGGSW